jgi:hypothetical protein
LRLFSAAILWSTDFSSVINAQNSVSFTPFVGWDNMTIQWKDGRVLQVFGIQLRERIPPNQPQISRSFHRCDLSRNAVSAAPPYYENHNN